MAKYDIHSTEDGEQFYETGEVRGLRKGDWFMPHFMPSTAYLAERDYPEHERRILAPVHADYVAYPLVFHPDGSPREGKLWLWDGCSSRAKCWTYVPGWDGTRAHLNRAVAVNKATGWRVQAEKPSALPDGSLGREAVAPVERYPLNAQPGEETFAVGERVRLSHCGPSGSCDTGVVVSFPAAPEGEVPIRLDNGWAASAMPREVVERLSPDGGLAPAPVERYPLCPWQGEKTFAVGERVIDKEWGPGVVVSRAEYMANAHCPGYDNHCVPVLFDNEVACLGRRYATISGSDLTREAPQSARSSPERARGWAPQGDVGAACFGNITDADAVALAANQPRTPQVREARRLDPYRPVREPRQYRAGLVGYDGEGW